MHQVSTFISLCLHRRAGLGTWLQVFEGDFGICFDLQPILDHDMKNLETFTSRNGRLLLAHRDTQLAGRACLRRVREELGEVKRMYVR